MGEDIKLKPDTKQKAFMSVEAKEINDKKKIITFRGTTITKDRMGDVVVPQGVDLKHFRTNPIFLWAHDWSGQRLPIGKSVKETITDDVGIDLDIQFDSEDKFAMDVYRKYKNGYLNAVSIGFRPQKWERVYEDDKFIGFKFNEWELLELSGVPIPANPEALQQNFYKFMKLLEKHPELKDLAELEAKGEGETKKQPELPFTYDKAKDTITIDGTTFTLDLLRSIDKKSMEEFREFKAGAVLSKKNKSMLEQAQQNINAVLESATQEEDPPEGHDGDEEEQQNDQSLDEDDKKFIEALKELGISKEDAIKYLGKKPANEPGQSFLKPDNIARMIGDAVEKRQKYLSGKIT